MNRFYLINLFIFFVFITRFDLFKCEDEESGEGGGTTPESSEEKKSEESSGGGGGGEGGNIGQNDGKCDCCDGEGIMCGLRLKWCGATGCDINNLYYCDKNNKKAYEYEICKHICITGHTKDNPDACSIKIDSSFLYFKKAKFDELKKEFKNRIENLNKTARANFEKLQHSFEVSPEERERIAKKMEQDKEALAAAVKAKTKGSSGDDEPEKQPEQTDKGSDKEEKVTEAAEE